MKKNNYILLLLIVTLCTSCSEGISILVKIIGLDSNTEKLELEFDYNRFAKNEKISVRNIKIYLNDTLNYELESETVSISKWKFPELPNGFIIKYPEGHDSIKTFSKTDHIRFEFKGNGKYSAYGSWEYKPKYSTKEFRWLFDSEGNKKISIDCAYEPWIGKDIIKIISYGEIEIDSKSFQLFDDENKGLEFTLKSKKDVTNRYALTLERDLKKGDIIHLFFKINSGEIYKEKITVPGKSIIGIIGKYNDL